MKRRLLKLWCDHRAVIVASAVTVLSCLLLFISGIGCPIKFFTGVSCAGCGMTRACLHALVFDFAEAFRYHPLWVILLPALLAFWFFKIKRKDKLANITLALFAAVMIAVYIYRLCFLHGDIVVFAPDNGFLFRTLLRVVEFFKNVI